MAKTETTINGPQHTTQTARRNNAHTHQVNKGDFRCSGMLTNSCSTGGTSRVVYVEHPVIRPGHGDLCKEKYSFFLLIHGLLLAWHSHNVIWAILISHEILV